MKFTFLWDILIKIINNFLKIGYFFSKKPAFFKKYEEAIWWVGKNSLTLPPNSIHMFN